MHTIAGRALSHGRNAALGVRPVGHFGATPDFLTSPCPLCYVVSGRHVEPKPMTSRKSMAVPRPLRYSRAPSCPWVESRRMTMPSRRRVAMPTSVEPVLPALHEHG